jgi:hypothetical protein
LAAKAVALRPTVKASRISSEDILDQRAELHAEDVHNSQGDDDDNGGQIGCIDANLHVAQHHRPDSESGYMGDVPQPVGRRDSGEKDAEELAEGCCNGGESACLNDQKERPAVEKPPEWPQRLAQIYVLAACFGHHGCQLAIAERANDGQEGCDNPSAQEKRR